MCWTKLRSKNKTVYHHIKCGREQLLIITIEVLNNIIVLLIIIVRTFARIAVATGQAPVHHLTLLRCLPSLLAVSRSAATLHSAAWMHG